MKGLLVKDLMLMRGQWKYFLIAIATGFFLLFMNGTTFGFFYLTFLFAYFTVSTISYDDYDNGMAYLMTLPVGRRTYVREKFLLGALLTFGGGLISMLITALVSLLSGSFLGPFAADEMEFGAVGEYLEFFLPFTIVLLMVLYVSVALFLKFGAEKARFVLFGLVALFCACIFVFAKAKDSASAKGLMASLSGWLQSNETLAIALAAAIAALIIGAAYLAAVKIMERKEF